MLDFFFNIQMILFRIIIVSLLFYPSTLRAQENHIASTAVCQQWQAEVDPTIKKIIGLPPLNEKNAAIFHAIECLLKLKGKTHKSVYDSGTVSYAYSTRFPAPSVELAALYYVSYLYLQDWRHAGAIVLLDKNGKRNSRRTISKAYKAYRIWFEKIKEGGLEKARESNLAPLTGTGLYWHP